MACGLAFSGCESKNPPPPAPPIGGPKPPTVTQSPPSNRPGVAKPAAPTADWFEEVTGRSGIEFVHHNGREGGQYLLIEMNGGGVAAVDFDLDSDIDLFVTGGGTISREVPVQIRGLPSALYRNDGDLKFVAATLPSGLGAAPDYSQGCAVTDFNLDGFPDLFLCCFGRNRLYQNLGDGTFVEAETKTSFPTQDWGLTAVFADIDRDSLPDLFVARYADWSPEQDIKCLYADQKRDICGPKSYPGTKCRAYHNLGDGRFEDWTDQVGIQGNVHGMAVVAADLNLDGWVDIYVTSDITPKQLYLGGPQLPLMEAGASSGTAVNEWGQNEGSMGVDVADYNGDGNPDIWVTNYEAEDNSLYRNQGQGRFTHSTTPAGLAGVSRMKSGFGTALADFDGDGWPDIFISNGNPIYAAAQSPFKQEPQLFRNLAGRRFADVTYQGGPFFREAHSGRGSAVADLDDDGALDVVVVPINDPVQVIRNRKTPRNYVRVQLLARQGEADATGARVWAEFDGRRVYQFATKGTGFFSQSDPRMIFPASPAASTVDVTVEWPGRGREKFPGLAVRQTHLITEGRGNVLP